MSKAILSAPHFHDEEAAYAYVEARLWKDGRDCPHCGVVDKSGPLTGKSTRIGVYKCYACRKPFTVKVGTVFEGSNVKMHIWLQAIHLMASSKKGFSANQFSRTLGISLKAGWFVAHRLREAMRSVDLIPFGKAGGAVESDETFWGQNPEAAPSRTPIRNMNMVLTLVDRETGAARSMVIDEMLNAENVTKILSDCAEFDFRYSNRVALGVDDQERADRILMGVKGKRLTYRPPHWERAA